MLGQNPPIICLQQINDDLLIISAPIYLIGMNIECWKCGKKMPVVALLAPDIEGSENEVCILSNIVSLPEKMRDYVKKRVPTFQQRYSKTVKDKYYANVCPNCGMLSGDFFLHSEPGAPFFPTSEHEAALLYLATIPADGKIQVRIPANPITDSGFIRSPERPNAKIRIVSL